jgi:hypothetical protein
MLFDEPGEVRAGKAVLKRSHRWERVDHIPHCAEAHHQNA